MTTHISTEGSVRSVIRRTNAEYDAYLRRWADLSNTGRVRAYTRTRAAIKNVIAQYSENDVRAQNAILRLAQLEAKSGHFTAARATSEHLHRGVFRSPLRRPAGARFNDVRALDREMNHERDQRRRNQEQATSDRLSAIIGEARLREEALRSECLKVIDHVDDMYSDEHIRACVHAVEQAVVWNALSRTIRRHHPREALEIAYLATSVVDIPIYEPGVEAAAERERALGLMACAGAAAAMGLIPVTVMGYLSQAEHIATALKATPPGAYGMGVTSAQLASLRGGIRRMMKKYSVAETTVPVVVPVPIHPHRGLRRLGVAVVAVVAFVAGSLLCGRSHRNHPTPPTPTPTTIVPPTPTPPTPTPPTPTPPPPTPPPPTPPTPTPPTPTPPTPTPPAPTPAPAPPAVVLTPAQEAHGLLYNAGFRGAQLRQMMYICYAENDGYKFDAQGRDPGGGLSLGFCAISATAKNMAADPGLKARILNPANNARLAYSIFQRGGFERWVTFNTGKANSDAVHDAVDAAYSANPTWPSLAIS